MIDSPINANYMDNVGLDSLIREVRETQLCDAKNKIGQFNSLQLALMNELLEGETKHLLIQKRKRKMQELRNARKRTQISA